MGPGGNVHMLNKVVSIVTKLIRQCVLVLCCLCLIVGSSVISLAKADNRGVDEATLRAAIILKIIQQISWPAELGDEINFCGAGGSKSYQKLLTLRGKPIARNMAHISFVDSTSANSCQIQIIGPNETPDDRNSEIHPLLVICDDCGEKRDFAAVELIKDREHIRFNLNLKEAQKTNIKFKVSLLELAKVVTGRND